MGEETAMTVRAFTHGYDLFHPAETVVWHDYLRADARKHWGDHTEAEGTRSCWSELDEKSKRKVQRLLRGERLRELRAWSGADARTVRGLRRVIFWAA